MSTSSGTTTLTDDCMTTRHEYCEGCGCPCHSGTVTIPQAEYEALVTKAGLADRLRQDYSEVPAGALMDAIVRFIVDYDALNRGATGRE